MSKVIGSRGSSLAKYLVMTPNIRGSLLGGRKVLDFDVDVCPTTGSGVVLTVQWIVEEEVEERGYHSGWTGSPSSTGWLAG